jgi:hypothetical protein
MESVRLKHQEEAAAHLKSAFSAPRIWTVLAGYFARFTSDPANAAPAKLALIHH